MLLALRVSGLSVGNAGDTYKVYAYFDNIAGVTVRGKVTLAGVTIGKVTAVDLDRDSYTGRVTMEINQNVNNLPVDSTASILTAGLLGEIHRHQRRRRRGRSEGRQHHPRHPVGAGAGRPDRQVPAELG